MKHATRFARVVFVAGLVAIGMVHVTWGNVYWNVGHPPGMGDSSSASTPLPLEFLPQISDWLIVVLIPAWPIALVISLVQAQQRRRESEYVTWALFGVLLTLVVWLDPFGAITWYAD